MPRSFNIVVHDLGLSPQQHVRVLIGQPTYAADDWTTRNDLYFARDIRSFRERIQGFIVEAVNSTADLIVLPELSVPLEAIDLLRSWSEQTGGVAVAGSHYFLSDGAYRSRCPIMISGDVFFTEKLASAQLHAARRGRMMSVSAEKAVVVDDGASKALRRRGSLLPVGIKGTVGKFGEGELIAVLDGNAKIIGVGITHYNSDDVRKISGRQSGEIGGVLDRFNGVTVIHADRFALKE